MTDVPFQNREYAVSQLNDLQQKLAKAVSIVPNTRAPAPALKDDNKAVLAKVRILSSNLRSWKHKVHQQEDKKKNESNQLVKSVKNVRVGLHIFIVFLYWFLSSDIYVKL